MRRIDWPRQLFILAACLALFSACGERSSQVAGSVAAAEVTTPLVTPPPNFAALVRAQGPAVVNISSTRKFKAMISVPGHPDLVPGDSLHSFLKRFGLSDGQTHDLQSESLGSGFIIDLDGYILTNSHVVEDADEVKVSLTDKREFKARQIGIDRRTDIALLKISATDLPVVRIGDPASLEVGEWVVAIGAPFGFRNSVTQGIVSAKGRDLPGEKLVPFIQTDVAINPGSSGGPLFNMNGEVVGINSQILSQSGGSMGIAFAIPIDIAMKVKEQLLKNGTVKRGKLGVVIQTLSQELAESFDLKKANGALIAGLEKHGAAEQAGLRVGDVVLAFDGQSVASASDLARYISESHPDAQVRLMIWREGKSRERIVRLAEAEADRPDRDLRETADRPDAQAGNRQAHGFGLHLRSLSRAEQRAYETDGTVMVEAVEGAAALAGIRPGDIILAINSTSIASVEQLHKELRGTGKRSALLVQRDEQTNTFISLDTRAP